MKVTALRAFHYSRDGITALLALPGDEAEVPDDLVNGLIAEGVVALIKAAPQPAPNPAPKPAAPPPPADQKPAAVTPVVAAAPTLGVATTGPPTAVKQKGS